MRADALRALAAQYRRLEKAYPAGGYDKSAEDCEREALKLEAEWAAEDARWATEDARWATEEMSQ